MWKKKFLTTKTLFGDILKISIKYCSYVTASFEGNIVTFKIVATQWNWGETR